MYKKTMFSFCKKKIAQKKNERTILTSGLFDTKWYVATYPEARDLKITPLAHYIEHWESRNPSPLFDTNYYLMQCEGVDFSTRPPLVHYLEEGGQEGVNPNPFFDSLWYARKYANTLQDLSPLEHYSLYGGSGDFDPCKDFSSRGYLQFNPDVEVCGCNPLWHYLSIGREEGRTDNHSEFIYCDGGEVECRIDLMKGTAEDEDVLLFVAYCPTSRLSDLQRQCIQKYIDCGFSVVLVVNASMVGKFTSAGMEGLKGCIVRENIGFDFGAWRHACELFRLEKAASVTFTNDSVFFIAPPSHDFRTKLKSVEGDVIFMTKNQEIKEHCQSYFFTLKADGLALNGLDVITNTPYYDSKTALINEVEVRLSSLFDKKGIDIGVMYVETKYDNCQRNLTVTKWDELIDLGFPFIKIQLFTQGLISLYDPAVVERISPACRMLIKEHLEIRSTRNPDKERLKRLPRPLREVVRFFKRIF